MMVQERDIFRGPFHGSGGGRGQYHGVLGRRDPRALPPDAVLKRGVQRVDLTRRRRALHHGRGKLGGEHGHGGLGGGGSGLGGDEPAREVDDADGAAPRSPHLEVGPLHRDLARKGQLQRKYTNYQLLGGGGAGRDDGGAVGRVVGGRTNVPSATIDGAICAPACVVRRANTRGKIIFVEQSYPGSAGLKSLDYSSFDSLRVQLDFQEGRKKNTVSRVGGGFTAVSTGLLLLSATRRVKITVCTNSL